MLLAAGIHTIPVTALIAGRTQTIHLTAMAEGSALALVDSGYPGQERLIIEALQEEGLDIGCLTGLVLTHQDVDHIGSAAALRNAARGRAAVYAHAAEFPYITGRLPLLKLTDAAIEAALRSLPTDLPADRRVALERALRNPPKVEVDIAVEAETALPLPGRPQVVRTPGRTPGHISLYFAEGSILVAGDCLFAENGRLLPPDPRLCADYAQALESVQKLASYNLRTVVCYHGGIVRGEINTQLRQLLEQLRT